MAPERPRRIRVRHEGEVARLLDQANTAPVLLESNGAVYRLTAEPRTRGKPNPEATIAAMHAAADAWKDSDPEMLKELIYRARDAGTRSA